MRKQGAAGRAKTLDFFWRFCGKEVYASHKYTRGKSGGAQGNQYKDIQEFVREANESRRNNAYFVAICDGDFYQALDGGVSRLQRLKNLANNKNVFVFSLSDKGFIAWLHSICSR